MKHNKLILLNQTIDNWELRSSSSCQLKEQTISVRGSGLQLLSTLPLYPSHHFTVFWPCWFESQAAWWLAVEKLIPVIQLLSHHSTGNKKRWIVSRVEEEANKKKKRESIYNWANMNIMFKHRNGIECFPVFFPSQSLQIKRLQKAMKNPRVKCWKAFLIHVSFELELRFRQRKTKSLL